ncbi:MAG: hypothetical protein E6J78_18520 [Deltaproteobacteria bacterium]|nr:MAG: hypothetical protein E6J78_18520 [Deltaproteobacteria bacterium]
MTPAFGWMKTSGARAAAKRTVAEDERRVALRLRHHRRLVALRLILQPEDADVVGLQMSRRRVGVALRRSCRVVVGEDHAVDVGLGVAPLQRRDHPADGMIGVLERIGARFLLGTVRRVAAPGSFSPTLTA